MFGRKKVVVKIEAKVIWRFAADPQSGVWIATCPALNLNASGRTWAELQEAANEATALLLEDLFEDNELERFLRERGWSLVTPLPPRGVKPRFDVPLEIERSQISDLMPASA